MIRYLVFAFSFLLFLPNAYAEDRQRAVISIIIDDIGYRTKEAKQLINLPANLTYAVLPNAPAAERLARLAHERGREVMLHMPMESISGKAAEKGVLKMNMGEKQVVSAIRAAVAKVPYAIGMNNHQGSLLTRHPGHMSWVMKEMGRQGYFFVDSMTSSRSVAGSIAEEQGVPVVKRDVFLDHSTDVRSIKRQFSRLIKMAWEKGHAVGIAHPHPETLRVLKEMLPMLSALQIDLVPVSRQVKPQQSLMLSAHKQ